MEALGTFPEIQAYWDAAARGRLLVKRCNDCNEIHHYPRKYCPFCASSNTVWLEVSGKGVIYSFTVWRRRDKSTIPAFVTLREGPTIMTEIVGADPERVKIGQMVHLARPGDPSSPLAFTLLEGDDRT